MFQGIDLSSDTATKPSMAMKKFMLNAELGDEQKSEDPTTLQLEKVAAELFGFESAIFLPSATMANQIAIQALSSPGDVLIAAENCHLFQVEHDAIDKHAQVHCHPIPTLTGTFTDEDLKQHIFKAKKEHPSSLIVLSIENTVNLGGGAVWSKAELSKIIAAAKAFHVKTHLDGARIFNACVQSNLSPQELTEGFDMVTVCLSKGLGCPVGALLIFNKPYYQRVLYLKKLMGGAMRQSGILAAAGIYALENNIKRLSIDHEHASIFATELSKLKNKIRLKNEKPETNMVYFEWIDNQISTEYFMKQCEKKGLRFLYKGNNNIFRAVMHLDISYQDVINAIKIIRNIS